MRVSGIYEDTLPVMLLLCTRQQIPSILFLQVKRLSLWSNTQKARDPSALSHTGILTELLWPIRRVQASPAACLVELLGLRSQYP